MRVLKTVSDPIDNFSSKFKALANEISRLAQSIGIEIVPYRDPNLTLFCAQKREDQQRIILDLSTYLSICQATIANGHSVSNTAKLTWFAIKQFGLRPPSDLFNYISGDDVVVEIHTPEFVQIFRNFMFYTCCSYSLEELYCQPFTILYSRDEVALSPLLESFRRLHTGQVTQTIPMNTPPHIISEVKSPFRYQIDAQVNYGAALFDKDNNVAATIVIEKGKVIGPALTGLEKTALLEQYYRAYRSPGPLPLA